MTSGKSSERRERKRSIYAEDELTQINRIIRNELWVMLPAKVVVCLAAFLYLQSAEIADHAGEPWLEFRSALGIYVASSFLVLMLRVELVRRNLAAVRFSAYGLAFIDGLFLCWMIKMTGGINSALYWFYCPLIVRNSANFPSLTRQTVLNVSFVALYLGVVYMGVNWEKDLWTTDFKTSLAFLSTNQFYFRLILLLLLSFCGWGVFNQLYLKQEEQLASQELLLRREKFSSQVKLASEVAHELKNPLAIITNALYLARSNVQKSDNEKINQHLDIIDDAVQRSDRIITDLLGYARMREGRIEESDVHENIDSALSMVLYGGTGYGNKVIVKKQYDLKLPPLLIDAGQLRQVFINLIRNALEAMGGESSKRLTIETGLDEINRIIIITIKDSGKGITPKNLERVFESFYTTKSTGSGLGLTIVRNIIENYNGRIDLASAVGDGTLVEIRFPLVISVTV